MRAPEQGASTSATISQFAVALLHRQAHAEQQKIAECLSSVDELMAAQARKVDALKTHKKGLMQQLFPREGETQPRLRFPEFQNAGEWEETHWRACEDQVPDELDHQDEHDGLMTFAHDSVIGMRQTRS